MSLPLCVGFRHKAAQVSLDCALASALTSLASPPSRLSQGPDGLLVQRFLTCPALTPGVCWGSWCSSRSSPALLSPRVCAGATALSSRPRLSLAHCVHKSVLYLCVSIPSPQIGSSVLFWILCACVNACFMCYFASVYPEMSVHIFCPLSNRTHFGDVFFFCVQFSSVQSLSHVRLFVTPWISARQASLSIINSRSSLRLTSIKSVMPSSHLILCHPLLLPPIPPSISLFCVLAFNFWDLRIIYFLDNDLLLDTCRYVVW